MNKDTRKVLNAAVKRGWVMHFGGKHFILVHPPSGNRVVVAKTASDRRALMNTRMDIKRIERHAAA